jgi:hypothetical protein
VKTEVEIARKMEEYAKLKLTMKTSTGKEMCTHSINILLWVLSNNKED